jgi:hypothetical protein
MRNFLNNLNIVGAVGVYFEGEICRHSIENLLSFCDKVVIMMDNPDDLTTSIILEYAGKYPEQIVFGKNNIPPLQSGESLMQRHKKYEGQIIQAAFDLVKIVHEQKPIDILCFIDSDEIFTDNLPNLMNKFWNSKADTCFIKPIEVFSSPYILINRGLVSHAKLYKYVPEISSVPYHKQNYYLPYRINRNIIKEPWNFVHLARLTEKNKEFRAVSRNRVTAKGLKLRRVSKPAWELTPQEMEIIERSSSFVDAQSWDGDLNKVPLIL